MLLLFVSLPYDGLPGYMTWVRGSYCVLPKDVFPVYFTNGPVLSPLSSRDGVGLPILKEVLYRYCMSQTR